MVKWIVFALHHGCMLASLKIISIAGLSFPANGTMSKSCFSQNCSWPQDTYEYKYCRCDQSCLDFSDCCPDAMAYNESQMQSSVNKYSCYTVSDRERAYMKMGCTDGWEDAKIASLCNAASPQNISKSKDLLLHIPVTNILTSISYPNYYCAICNRDTVNIDTWNVNLFCKMKNRNDFKNVFSFSGWKSYDTKSFNYTKWQNYNITQKYDYNLYTELSNNVGVTNYIKSNLIFSDNNNGYIFQINEKYMQTTVPCNLEVVRPNYTRYCVSPVHTCAVDWHCKETERLCHSYIDFVLSFPDEVVYKNPYCALCNHIPPEKMACYGEILHYEPHFLSQILNAPEPMHGNFSSPTSCAENERYFPGYNSCEGTICLLSSEIHRRGVCIKKSNLRSMYSNGVQELNLQVRNVSYDLQSQKNVSACPKLFSCKEVFVRDEDFSFSGNNTVSLEYGDIKLNECYQKVQGGIIICLISSRTVIVLRWISFVFLILSTIGLILHLLAFFLIGHYKNLSGKNLASLCTCLLVAYILLIISPTQTQDTVGCYAVASLMYFSFFASFCWMNVIAFDTWDSFRSATSHLHLRRGEQWQRFLIYSVYSWLLAITATCALVLTDQFAPKGLPPHFYPELGQHECWFGQKRALVLFFVLPISIFISLNVFFFFSTAWMLLRNKSLPHGNISSIDKHLFQIYGRLSILMGIAWATGITAYAVDNEIIWFIFIFLNTLQGAFIFKTFTFRKSVWFKIVVVCGCAAETTMSTTSLRMLHSPDDEFQQPYATPRIELLHVSTFLDRIHWPSRLS